MKKFVLENSNLCLHDNKLEHTNSDNEARWCASLADINEVRQFIGIDPNGSCLLASALATWVLMRETNPGFWLTLLAYVFELVCVLLGLICVRQRKLGVVANGKQYKADLFDIEEEDEFVAELRRQMKFVTGQKNVSA